MTETVEATSQGCDKSLVEAKEFWVATEKLLCHDRVSWSCAATEFLCHDRVWLRLKGFLSRHNNFRSD